MVWRNGKRTVRCRRCWETGHNRRNCPRNSAEEKEAYSNGNKARLCSYCGEPKHNRISCPKRKSDITNYIADNAVYRQTILTHMQNIGLGIGALVSTDTIAEEQNVENMYIVTDIDWHNIHKRRECCRVLKVLRLSDHDQYSLTIPPVDPNADAHRYRWHDAYVINRVKSVDDISPPVGWLDGGSGAERFFG